MSIYSKLLRLDRIFFVLILALIFLTLICYAHTTGNINSASILDLKPYINYYNTEQISQMELPTVKLESLLESKGDYQYKFITISESEDEFYIEDSSIIGGEGGVLNINSIYFEEALSNITDPFLKKNIEEALNICLDTETQMPLNYSSTISNKNLGTIKPYIIYKVYDIGVEKKVFGDLKSQKIVKIAVAKKVAFLSAKY